MPESKIASKSLIPQVLSGVFLVLFILFEFVFEGRIDAISPYALYVLEVVFVTLVLASLKKAGLSENKPTVMDIAVIASLLVLGAIVHFVAKLSGIGVPFDLSSPETILFLLVIGPLLEEFLFRGALWRIMEELTQNDLGKNKVPYIGPALLTSVLFSYGHFHLISSLPDIVHPFVYYQAGYTLLLGFICAYLRKASGLFFAIIGHMLFNAGFWLVSFI